MKFNAKLFLLFFVSFGFLLGNTIDNLKIYTEEYPPYNYFNQNKNKVEDINKYNIGVVRDDVAEQILINSGIDSKKIQQAHSPVLCARMLEAGRIDLWAYGEGPARFIMRTDFGGFDNYEVVNVLREGEMYIGFHKDTPDEIVNMFRKSLDKLKTVDIDKYNAILKKYL